MDTDIILGGSIAGLAASLSGTPVIDELLEGPSGTDYAYCTPLLENARMYKRPRSSEWARGDATRRAYQFYSAGLEPIDGATSPLIIDYLRRESSVVSMPFESWLFDIRESELCVVAGDSSSHPLSISTGGELAFLMLDPARFTTSLAGLCRVKRGFRIGRIEVNRGRLIYFNQQPSLKFERLVSTLPIDYLMTLVKLPDYEHKPSTHPVQVLNMGLRLNAPCPVPETIHQACFERSADTIIDAIDFYSHVDYESFTPSHEKTRDRLAIAVKHWVGANEVPLTQRGFGDRVWRDLKRMGFSADIDCMSYHWIEGGVTDGYAREDTVAQLQAHGIYSLGNAAHGLPARLADDLIAGFGSGLLLAGKSDWRS